MKGGVPSINSNQTEPDAPFSHYMQIPAYPQPTRPDPIERWGDPRGMAGQMSEVMY